MDEAISEAIAQQRPMTLLGTTQADVARFMHMVNRVLNGLIPHRGYGQ